MPNPMRKHTRSRQGKRRASWKLVQPSATMCPQCGVPVLSHRACTACGFYRGRQVIMVKAKQSKPKS